MGVLDFFVGVLVLLDLMGEARAGEFLVGEFLVDTLVLFDGFLTALGLVDLLVAVFFVAVFFVAVLFTGDLLGLFTDALQFTDFLGEPRLVQLFSIFHTLK